MAGFVSALSLVFVLSTFVAPRSLLVNGGFESAAGWSIGLGARTDTAVSHGGSRSLEVEGATAAEQLVYGITAGRALTLSGWIQTRAVSSLANGGYAFLAVYQMDSDGRTVDFRDIAQPAGTTAWTRYTATFRVRPSAEYLSIRAGIHNATGTAWFDDVNLVDGDIARDWVERSAHAAGAPAAYRAAILDDASLPVVGRATPVATFRRALAAEHVSLTSMSADEVSDPANLTTDRFDMLIVPTGATYPVAGRRALLSFLMHGGNLLTTGGYAFDHLVSRRDGKWIPYVDFLKAEAARARDPLVHSVPNGGFEAAFTGWTASPPGLCRVVEDRPFAGKKCALVSSDIDTGGSGIVTTLAVEPGETYLIGAQARASDVRGSAFAYLAVYQLDADGKLVTFVDFAHLHGSANWQRIETRVTVSPLAKRVEFRAGLYLAAGKLWVDEVTCAPFPREERINAHYGEPGDGLGLTPMQLTLFSPDQRFAGATLRSVWPGAPSPPLSGPIVGYEATAQLRQNGRWQPLLEARDRYGRPSGVAGALVSHYGGPFAGSRWALFGVENRDVFAGPAGERVLRHVIRLLKSGTTAEALTTDYATYRTGEHVMARLTLRNRAYPRASVRVRFAFAPPDPPNAAPVYTTERPVTLDADSHTDLAFDWSVPSNAPDFLQATATVLENGHVLDRIETGFCVHSPSTIARGTKIVFRNNAFVLTPSNPKPRIPNPKPTLFGTDTYGNMLGSRSCNPLTWYRDLQTMRDHGLHMFEMLQPAPPGYIFDDRAWRQYDALVQLSQRFGLPYMAGLLIGQDVVVDDDVLTRQAAMCRAFAARYKSVPGLIYYLNGDFQCNLRDTPDIRRHWNEFLHTRYGNEDALRKAWSDDPPEARLGAIPVRDVQPKGVFGARARDTNQFKNRLMVRWIDALCAAIRSVDSVHPITSEHYQRPVGGIDLRVTMGEMDAANIGYFDAARTDVDKLLATIKWNDMRWAGKTVNMGEFGVKTHDAWCRQNDASGYHVARTEQEQRQLFWTVVHAALAFGVTKIQNWCWSDDPDNVFPWGIAWQNPLRPKPVLKLYRNLRMLSDLVPQEYRPADVVLVVPENWRAAWPDGPVYGGVMNAIECLLATGVPFDVANESDLAKLASKPPKLVLAPLAYGFSDAELDALAAIATAGGRVYLSGDVGIGPLGERDDARLERLCGVRRSGESRLGLAGPIPAVTPTGARPMSERSGAPIYRYALGKGDVIYSPDPWECFPGHEIFDREPEMTRSELHNPYLVLVRLAGLARTTATTTSSDVFRAMTTRVRDGSIVTVFPRSEHVGSATVTVANGNMSMVFRTRTGWPCSALLNGTGDVTAASAGLALTHGHLDVHAPDAWMLVSLDGRPLNRSRAFVGMVTGSGGALAMRHDAATALTATVVEWRNGECVPVAPAAIHTVRGRLSIDAPPEDLVLVVPRGERNSWLAKLRR